MSTTAPARHVAPTEVGEDADLALLTGPESEAIVQAALVGDGLPPAGLHVEVGAVHHRPGIGVTVCYDVTYAAVPAGEVVVATTAVPTRHDVGERVAELSDGTRQIRVWRRSDDPALPGLGAALDPAVVAGWLRLDELPAINVLSYRPTRRAVVVATTPGSVTFIKVVRPRRAGDLMTRHELLAKSSVPAPAVLAHPTPGVVLLAAAPGQSLAQALASRRPEAVPEPDSVLAALDQMPAGVLELSRRPSWVDRIDFHSAAARSALPDRSADVDEVVAQVSEVLLRCPQCEDVPTHGDLNVANLFVDNGAPGAFIDVDSLGPGRRADDLATLLAHLAVLPALAPTIYAHVPCVLACWRAVFAESVGAAELDARTAAVLVSLVAGAPHEQAHARLRLAQATARRAIEESR